MSQAGAAVLVDTIMDAVLQQALAPWKKPLAWHDPAKIVLDQVVSLPTGGDCLADVHRFRDQPGALFGAVASASTITRLIATLSADRHRALAAINAPRAQIRARVWQAAGRHAPTAQVTADDPHR